jgi:hypothetical protein
MPENGVSLVTALGAPAVAEPEVSGPHVYLEDEHIRALELQGMKPGDEMEMLVYARIRSMTVSKEKDGGEKYSGSLELREAQVVERDHSGMYPNSAMNS